MPDIFGIKIDGIKESIKEQDIRRLLKGYEIYSVSIGHNKLSAYVNFLSNDQARSVVKKFNNITFNGNKISVSLCPRKDFKKVTDCKFGDLCEKGVCFFFDFLH